MLTIFYGLIFGIISGILGRMGGAKGYNTKYRDVGCSLIIIFHYCLLFGINYHFWYIYLIIFGLQWGALSTYGDTLFGYDNFWFAGFICGLAFLPITIIYPSLLFYFLIRIFILTIVWGLLHKRRVNKFFIWQGDVAEEFFRYFLLGV